MTKQEAEEIFNLGGHLIKVLLDENFHSHKAESVALKSLKAKGFLEGYAEAEKRAEVLVEALKALRHKSFSWRNAELVINQVLQKWEESK